MLTEKLLITLMLLRSSIHRFDNHLSRFFLTVVTKPANPEYYHNHVAITGQDLRSRSPDKHNEYSSICSRHSHHILRICIFHENSQRRGNKDHEE